MSSCSKPSTRLRLDGMSGLPPLYAATTRAPGTCSGSRSSFSIRVKWITCDVSVLTIPSLISAPKRTLPQKTQTNKLKHVPPTLEHELGNECGDKLSTQAA